MGILDRYKKQGGFKSLLFLLETCGPQKQAKLLESVQSDNPNWAEALSQKILTVRRIIGWDANALQIIFREVQDLTLAYVVKGLSDSEKKMVFEICSKREEQKLLEIIEFQNPNSAEVSTAFRKFIEGVRELIETGVLNVKQIDPSLIIEPDLERHLSEKNENTGPVPSLSQSSFFTEPAATMKTSDSKKTKKSPSAEVSKNNTRLQLMIREKIFVDQENLKLKNEVAELKYKIDRIKKLIAS